MHEEFLYCYNNHLHNMSSRNLTQTIFAYNSIITDNVTAQFSLCAKRLQGQQPY